MWLSSRTGGSCEMEVLLSWDGDGIALASSEGPVTSDSASVGCSEPSATSSGGGCLMLAVSITFTASRHRIGKSVILSPEHFRILAMKMVLEMNECKTPKAWSSVMII